MCGIAGYFSLKRHSAGVSHTTLARMRDSMQYRGPDEIGISVDSHGTWGIAHCRLSILGVEDGQQPMWVDNGNLGIAFNGEIFNFLELRNDLQKLGFTFHTHSDTEVVLRAYQAWGTDALSKFDGMFALSIIDIKNDLMLLARDRVGKKPLFIWLRKSDNTLFFASEIKCLLQVMNSSPDVNKQGLYEILRYGAAVGNNTLISGITRLEPGSFLNLSNAGMSLHRYWDICKIAAQPFDSDNENDLIDRIDTTFIHSVNQRMISEVPLGAYLSGGVDSSLVVAAMALNSSNKVNTFSVIFEDHNYNEEEFSDQIAAKYNTCHHKLRFSEEDLLEAIPSWIEHMDDLVPQRDGLPRFLIAKLVKNFGIKVVLSGSGADELFGGYRSHLFWKRVKFLKNLCSSYPDPLLSLFAKISDKIAHSWEGWPAGKLHHFSNLLYRLPKHECFYRGETDYFRQNSINNVLAFSAQESIASVYSQATQSGCDSVNEALLVDILNRLPNDALMREDRLNMAHSLEGRVPILSYKMIELAMMIPGTWKIRNGEQKWIWKKFAERYLPKNLIYRRKVGFGYPMEEWLKTKLNILIKRFFFEEKILPYFHYKQIQKLCQEHLTGKAWRPGEIWSLLAVEMWFRRWILGKRLSWDHNILIIE